MSYQDMLAELDAARGSFDQAVLAAVRTGGDFKAEYDELQRCALQVFGDRSLGVSLILSGAASFADAVVGSIAPEVDACP